MIGDVRGDGEECKFLMDAQVDGSGIGSGGGDLNGRIWLDENKRSEVELIFFSSDCS